MDKNVLLQKAHEYIASEADAYFRQEVEDLVKNELYDNLNDRFYTELSFGTGGLRGVIGGGFNRMNPYIVRKATQGLATYIKNTTNDNGSIAIAYDSRNFSDVFALEAAQVLCGNGIKTYLFTSLRSTPELSFAVRKLNTTAGILITASHNPPEYNGYKVYWSDGAQIVPPHDSGIIKEVRSVDAISVMDKAKALDTGMLVMIDSEIDTPFIRMVKDQALRPSLIREQGKKLKIVYTPLHGTGAIPVDTALKDMGIEVIFVNEQKEPDGNFPTVVFPNPEEASAMKLALELGKKEKADLVMGTDPDADRLGIAVPDGEEMRLVTGNQLGVLLADYIFSTRKELGTLPEKPAFVKTIVTSELQRLIAENYGAQTFDTLTGFKYIGEKIHEFESTPDGPTYIFGGEESYGYLTNTHVRDKDAVSAATMTAEMALYHLTQGRSLLDQLKIIWEMYGYFKELLISKYFKGQEGLQTMNNLMEQLRTDPPKTLAGQKIVLMKDYRKQIALSLEDGTKQSDINLPSSNVLQFILDDNSIVTARPSGTEPKIKFYASCRSDASMPLDDAIPMVEKKIEAIDAALNQLIEE